MPPSITLLTFCAAARATATYNPKTHEVFVKAANFFPRHSLTILKLKLS
jgi:hypothetical protein